MYTSAAPQKALDAAAPQQALDAAAPQQELDADYTDSPDDDGGFTVAINTHVRSDDDFDKTKLPIDKQIPPINKQINTGLLWADPMAVDPIWLTAVTIDVCSLKTALDFTDPTFISLTANIAGAAHQTRAASASSVGAGSGGGAGDAAAKSVATTKPSILRIGGTDQNSFDYNMDNTRPMTPCECGSPCTMTARYWDQINAFARDAGIKLIFGLNPSSASNAIELIQYTARRNYTTVFAYSYGNEQVGGGALAEKLFSDMTKVRLAIDAAYVHRTLYTQRGCSMRSTFTQIVAVLCRLFITF